MVYGWPARLAGLVPAGLVAACLAAPPAGDEPATVVAAALDAQKDPASTAPIDWGQGDCLSQLRILQRAAREGGLGPDERPPFAVELVAPSGTWLDGVPDVPIEVDLPLAMADAGPADGVRCVLRIGPARQQSAAHRAVDLQDVHSAYQSALRSERNPDYDAAQLKLRQARGQAKGGQKIVRTNDPLLDLIGSAVGGVIATFDRRSKRQTLDAAAAELAATPRSRDKPVYRPYSFERVVVRAQKQALVPVALLDASGRRLQATELRQSERREFFLLRGLDPRDRDYEQHRTTSMTRADLARWARTPPALRLSSVAIALTEGVPALESHLAALAPAEEPLALPNGAAEPFDWGGEIAATDQPVDPWLEDAFADKDAGLPSFEADLDEESSAVPLAPIAAGLPDPFQVGSTRRQPPPRGHPQSTVAMGGREGERAGSALSKNALGTGPVGFDIADLAPGIAAGSPVDRAPAALPAHASVVVVRAGRTVGSGFYVRKDLVLTTYGVVGPISVVDVTTADGATVPALVAAVDPASGLALLQVPRPGPAVILHEGPGAPERPIGLDPGPGHPLFDNDQLVGMTSDAASGGEGVIAIDAIRGFLDGQAGVLAAIP